MRAFLSQPNKTYLFAILILIGAVSIRAGLFYTKWSNLRHGSALIYGSVAMGIWGGEGITYNELEMSKISKEKNNYSGNYLAWHSDKNRQKSTIFLPGPAILLSLLWKIIPVYNFAPYIGLQIILDSILILSFYLVFKNNNRDIVLFATILMIFNLPVIRRSLMMGYDFWPQFAVLVTFIGIYYGLVKNKSYLFFITGLLVGLTVWFRSITSFLPFFVVLFIVVYQKFSEKKKLSCAIKKGLFFILPVIFLIVPLSIFRFHQTGNMRPTRSTFWHSFFAGIGQFSNPYGLRSNANDQDVWEFGRTLNNELKNHRLIEMYKSPNSIYEETLEKEGIIFIKKYPHLFIRNTFYRIGIMISPFLYRGGDFIPDSLFNLLIPVGVVAFILWFLGMYYLFKNQQLIFWLSVTIYFYFFSAFGWFYIVGRVILPFLFLNIILYLFGLKYLYLKFNRKFCRSKWAYS